MQVLTEADREFWRGVLGMGGFTALPRWTRNPIAGVAVHDAAIPEGLVAALRRLAGRRSPTPLSAVLLATHGKVLSALSGERHVATGYIGATGPGPLPCQLTTEAEFVARAPAAGHSTASRRAPCRTQTLRWTSSDAS